MRRVLSKIPARNRADLDVLRTKRGSRVWLQGFLSVWIIGLTAGSADAALFTWQSPGGHLPMIVSNAPIGGTDSLSLPYFPGSLNGTELFGLAWRGDYTSLGLGMSYQVSGDSTVGPWSSTGAGGTTSVKSIDSITISGGSGGGILRVGLDVHGTQSALAGSSLFRADVQTIANWNGGQVSFIGPGIFAFDIPFVFGTSFTLERTFFLTVGFSALGSTTGGPWGPLGGSADYLNSAEFGFRVLDTMGNSVAGATVASSAGFVYPQVGTTGTGTVPEPSALLLLGLGLIIIATGRRARGTGGSGSL